MRFTTKAYTCYDNLITTISMKENIGRQTAIMRMAEVGITPEKVQQGESEFDDIELGC